MTRRGPLLHCAVITAFVVIAYLPSFDVDFVFDDVPNFVVNAAVQPESLSELPNALFSRGSGDPVGDRSTAMLTFAVNYLVSGLDPFSYHLFNLLIHLAAALVLYALVRSLAMAGQHRAAAPTASQFAFLAVLLWALHPIHTQAVTYVVQRMTSMAALFYVLALWIFVLQRTQRLSANYALPLIAICFLLGITTKPIVVTLPAALLAIDVFLQRRWSRIHSYIAAGVAVLAVMVTLIWGYALLGDLSKTYPNRNFTGYERLLTQGRVLWHYLGLWFWPNPARFQLDYAIEPSRGWLQPLTTFLGWGAIAGVSMALGWFARRLPWLSLGWFFFLIAASVEASFLNLELVFEHRMYLPSMLILPGVMAVLSRQGLGRMMLPLLIVAGLLGWATIERNRDWAQVEGFWAEEVQRGASIERASINAAVRYNMVGRPQAALVVIERALPSEQPLGTARLLQQRGEAELGLGRLQDAERSFLQVLQIAPHWIRTHYYLGQVLLQQGRLQQAAGIAERVREGRPSNVYGVALDALVRQHRGRPAEAVEMLERYLEEHPRLGVPNEFVARMHLANAHRATGNPQLAYEQYQLIVQKDPRFWAAWANIYHMLKAGGDDEQAARVERYLHTRGIDPSAWAGQ